MFDHEWKGMEMDRNMRETMYIRSRFPESMPAGKTGPRKSELFEFDKESSKLDKISLNGLTIFTEQQGNLEEKSFGKKLVLDLDLYMDISKSADSDSIADTVDFKGLILYLFRLCQTKHFRLIEAQAQYLAQSILLDYPLIKKVKLKLSDPAGIARYPLSGVSVSVTREWNTVFIGLSSNAEEKATYLDFAEDQIIENKFCRFLKASDFYPKDASKIKGMFLNGVLEIQTILSPTELLKFVQSIEEEAGRDRSDGTDIKKLDLDILLFGREIIDTQELSIPHKKLQDRDYVLEPLVEIAPYVRHPITYVTAREMLEEFRKNEERQKSEQVSEPEKEADVSEAAPVVPDAAGKKNEGKSE